MNAETLAACPFSNAQEYATQYLERAEAGGKENEIRVPIRFLPPIFRRRVSLTFGLHSDTTEPGRSHYEIRVRWLAGTPLIPDFHGSVRFRIAGDNITKVLVEGSYHAPFGLVGRGFDKAIGSHLARASVRDLSLRLARHLEEKHEVWLALVRQAALVR